MVTSSFLNGPGVSTLPIVIFARARLGLNPTVNAVATLSVAVVSIGVLTGSLWMARNERRRAEEQAAAYREGMLQIGPRGSLTPDPSAARAPDGR